MLTVKVTINVAGQTVPQVIPVVQGDTGRAIFFTLADFTIPTGATATYYVQKPSGEAVYNAATIDGNTVLVELTAQSIIEVGDNYGQVRIEKDDEVVTSFDFILLVKPFRGIDATQSTTEMNIFDKAVEQAEEAIDEAKVAALEEIAEAGSGNIAEEFDAANSYLAGEYTIYNAKLYRFTSNHTGAWSGSDAEEVTVGDELTDIKDGFDDLDDRVTALEEGGSGGGLTDDIKQALLQILENVAFIDDDGQDYYNALESALYPSAEVASISAVYTQSEPVYENAELVSLKADLVVTAHYSDGTEVVVTRYTLSGTLAVGTSTVTVTYGGKSTTFTVTVSAWIPSTYTEYSYIGMPTTKSSSPKERWIELKKYDDLNNVSVEFKFSSYIGHTNGVAIFGRRLESGFASSYAFYAGNGGLGYHLHGVDSANPPQYVTGEVHIAKYTNTAESPSSLVVNDGQPVSIVWNNDTVLNLAPVLFANPINDGNINLVHAAKIGYMKFYDLSGNLLNYYVPCVRNSDNVIGMYDVVEQTFYTPTSSQYATIGNSNCYYEVGIWS